MFVDEIFLRLHSKGTRLRVRRRQGEKFERRYIQPSFKFGGGGIMFWGVISWRGQGTLVLFEGAKNGRTYTEILEDWILGTLRDLKMIHPYLLDDHARSHDT